MVVTLNGVVTRMPRAIVQAQANGKTNHEPDLKATGASKYMGIPGPSVPNLKPSYCEWLTEHKRIKGSSKA